jgi:hypothetical protein
MLPLLILFTVAPFGCASRGSDAGSDGGGTTDGGTVTCGRAAANPNPTDALATLQYGMAATWNGTATTPDGWVPASQFTVEISFAADGTYEAHTTDASGSLPFYYDRDPESDRYTLVGLDSSGGGSGNLFLEWDDTPDSIDAVRFDAAQTHLHLEYTHNGHGPVVYELDCAQ